jgi:hypothetical protein
MSHPLVIGLFENPALAAKAARGLHELGVPREQISVVARNHDEEGALADQWDATPGAEVEDSRAAGRLGELGAQVLAAIAIVMPGIGPIVAAGPLSAGLGEAAGHVAGGVASVLSNAGVEPTRARALQDEVRSGAILLAVHLRDGRVTQAEAVMRQAGAATVDIVNWEEPR